jgi:putative phosphoribosyl transferase
MTGTSFRDRRDAGRRLGARLATMGLPDPVVLGLARGGVLVAAEVAEAIGGDLDVLVARKIGHPRQPEYGLGAVAEGGEPVYDQQALERHGMRPSDLEPIVAAERVELRRRMRLYRGDRPFPTLAQRSVVLVDDGIATGVTARAGLRALRAHGPGRLLLAVPVAAAASVRDLAAAADEVVVLEQPARFRAVGQWYDVFDQVSDEQVLAALATPPDRRSR